MFLSSIQGLKKKTPHEYAVAELISSIYYEAYNNRSNPLHPSASPHWQPTSSLLAVQNEH